MKKEMLRVDNLSISSDDEDSLNTINFNLYEGELISFFGSNESGKADLAKAISAFPQITHGKIYIDGVELNPHTYETAQKMGLFYLSNNSMLIQNMTVMENIFIIRKKSTHTFLIKEDMHRQTEFIQQEYGINIALDKHVSDLSQFESFFVQIIKVLLMGAKIIIIDELCTKMYNTDLLKLLGIIKNQEKTAFIYISHIIDKVIDSSNRIVVMKQGRIIKIIYKNEYSRSFLNKCEHGMHIAKAFRRAPNPIGNIVFTMENFKVSRRLLNLSVAQGEIVGILNIDGIGNQIINKLTKHTINGIYIDGVNIRKFEDAVKSGMAVIKNWFDFNDHFECFDSTKNLTFDLLKKISRFGIINKKLENYVVNNLAPGIVDRNIQSINWYRFKTLLYRRLIARPRIIFVDNITLGFDIKVREEILLILNQASKEQAGIVAIFSDIADCINYCDKIYVLSENGDDFMVFTRSESNYSELISLMENRNYQLLN